jgi:CelD/BcsL family acetyltransferase involved in cellulose biosynthesis
MALVKTSYHGLPLRRLRWMGAPDSDYQDFVCVRRREECAAAFLADLEANKDWTFCEFGSLRPELLALLSAARAGTPVSVDECMTLPLPASHDEFARALGRHRRKSLRQRSSLLQAEHGDFSFSTVESLGELQPALDDLFRLHALRREEVALGASSFTQESVLAFHRDLAAVFLQKGWLRLHRLWVGDRCIAAAYCFHQGGATYFYQSGFDPAFSRYSPGVLVTHCAIGRAIDDGAREFDFMRGAESYKSRWRAQTRPNGHMIFSHDGLVSRAAATTRRLERAIWARYQTWRGGDAESDAAEPSQSSNTPSSA